MLKFGTLKFETRSFRTLTLAAALFGLFHLTACGGGELGDGAESLDGDAGSVSNDAPGLRDGGESVGDICAAFVNRVCGPGGTTCLDNGACQAALLIDRYERDRCAPGLDDTFVYPTCEADACTRLLNKVCGEDGQCAGAGACVQAGVLLDQLEDPDAQDADRTAAKEACAAGLVDDVVFVGCP